MDLIKDKRLRTFITVTECSSLTKAAKKLYVSQSALSQQILSLEQDLGVPLLDRTRFGVSLTPSGELFYRRMKEILSEIDDLVIQVHQEVKSKKTTIVIGLRTDSDSRIVNVVTPAFKERFPQISFIMRSFDNRTAEEMLSDDYDLLELPFSRNLDTGRIAFHPLQSEESCLCIPPRHPLAGKEILTEEDLDGETIVLFPEGHLEDCDSIRRHLAHTHAHIENREYNGLTSIECITNGWLMHAPIGYASRYAPMVPVKLAWHPVTRIGLVTAKDTDPLVKAYVLLAKDIFSR